MLSTETLPVEMIATDERGCPRWVMCHWTDDDPDLKPERVLLLAPPNIGGTLCTVFVLGEDGSRTVSADILHEITPE
jgi:hypothetical protein